MVCLPHPRTSDEPAIGPAAQSVQGGDSASASASSPFAPERCRLRATSSRSRSFYGVIVMIPSRVSIYLLAVGSSWIAYEHG